MKKRNYYKASKPTFVQIYLDKSPKSRKWDIYKYLIFGKFLTKLAIVDKGKTCSKGKLLASPSIIRAFTLVDSEAIQKF